MNNALIEKPKTEVATVNAMPNLTSHVDVKGNNNVVNEFVNQQTNITIINQAPSQGTVNPAWCNVFVLKGKTFTGGCFSILKSRVHVSVINASDARSYPALFVTANDEYTRCTKFDQQFHYGRVTAIEDEQDSVKISYEIRPTQPLYQRDLNAVAKKLEITPMKGKDILGETGWTTYPIDIVKELTDAGINMTVY
jgi:hypothetical protein